MTAGAEHTVLFCAFASATDERVGPDVADVAIIHRRQDGDGKHTWRWAMKTWHDVKDRYSAR